MVTLSQPNGCQGTVSGGVNFNYKVEQSPQGGMIATVTSGAHFGVTGTVSNTAPRTIVWGDGTVYTQQGGSSPSPGFGGLPGFPTNPTPQCADLSGQYQSSFDNQMVTLSQPNGCQGTVSGGVNFNYKVEQSPQGGMIATVTSGAHFGVTGTVSNTAPRTIVWGDGTVYTQQGGFPGDPSCVDLTGQYTSDAGQTYFFAQNGCEGTVGGDASFTYTISGNQVTDGNGNSGTFSSTEPRTITFSGGAVVWTQSGGGSNPSPPPRRRYSRPPPRRRYSGKGGI